jgi:tetratricopeptide (TPR) repeat protein
MGTSKAFIKLAVAASAILWSQWAMGGDAVAQGNFDRSDQLMQQLRDGDLAQAKQIERELALIWKRSGSATADLLLTRAQDALKAGEEAKAITLLSALIDHSPDFAESWYLRAMAFFKQEEFGLAASDLGRALTLNPNHFNAILGQAVILETLGHQEAAYRAYSKVLDLYPTHERAQKSADRLRKTALGQDL